MGTGQREFRLTVIKAGRLPCRRRVAQLALCRETRARVIRRFRGVVVLQVTPGTRSRGAAVLAAHMAVDARETLVRSG